MSTEAQLQVAVIMGSKSDWETMRSAAETLEELGIRHECRVLSAHRTPRELAEYIESAEARGCQAFIAGAGGAAHLPGVIASQTLRPVLGVPLDATSLNGLDALLSIVQMPSGIPVGTLGVGKSGAINSALLAAAILANNWPELRGKLEHYRTKGAEKVQNETLPRAGGGIGFATPGNG